MRRGSARIAGVLMVVALAVLSMALIVRAIHNTLVENVEKTTLKENA